MKQYEQKYDFINKALLESVAQITKMAKSDHPTAAARVKSADKMVMLPPLFDSSKPEVVKQHYERFNQYIKFQTKSGNIRDKYLQDAEQHCALELNYFDDITSPMSAEPTLEEAEQISQSSECNSSSA